MRQHLMRHKQFDKVTTTLAPNREHLLGVKNYFAAIKRDDSDRYREITLLTDCARLVDSRRERTEEKNRLNDSDLREKSFCENR